MRVSAAGALAALVLWALVSQAAEPGQSCREPEPKPAVATSDAAAALLARADAARARVEAGGGEDVAAELDALLGQAQQLSDPAERAHLRIHLARSLAKAGHSRRAAEVLLLAADDARGHDPRLESYALGRLAELYEEAKRLDEASGLARRALFAAQQAQAPDAVVRWQWLLARLGLAAGNEEQAVADYRSAVATLRRAPELAGPDFEPLYLGFADLLLRRSASADAAGQQALLSEVRSALEDFKAGELRDYFRDPCLDAQRKAAPDMVPGALVVYPVLLPDRLELIAGRGGHLSRHVVDVGREQFTETARDLRRKIEKRTTREFLRPAAALYEWLIRPLDLTGVKTLVFVPGRGTRALPLAALYDAKAKQYLIEQVPVAITPDLTLTDPRPIDPGAVRMLEAGVSQAVQGYPALAGVRREVDDLHQEFGGVRLLDRSFVTSRFEHDLESRPFDVVHVASHGEFRADSRDSYLLTYDGRIPMDELGKLVGTTRFRKHGLELLTLSACRTAVGDDRAALGLAGVALRAGARSALATLWAVNDEVSSDLMIEFYRQLGAGASRAVALQRAQLSILHKRAYRHPAYWAPYLLISSWL